jgi:hypothetical protein
LGSAFFDDSISRRRGGADFEISRSTQLSVLCVANFTQHESGGGPPLALCVDYNNRRRDLYATRIRKRSIASSSVASSPSRRGFTSFLVGASLSACRNPSPPPPMVDDQNDNATRVQGYLDGSDVGIFVSVTSPKWRGFNGITLQSQLVEASRLVRGVCFPATNVEAVASA